ncbi:asparagine synthetase [Thermostichus vulcanus NIES-2134]|nr:asparagine synthetase [Thermostichus vulcanus NIES-2134]
MCGLTGFWSPRGCHTDEANATVRRMGETLVHREPDDARLWVDAESVVALGAPSAGYS